MKYYKCVYCGRIFKSEYMPHIPHRCNTGFRKRHLEFTELKYLHLTLIGKWYDMIQSGEKKEEYRATTEYWYKRLCGSKFPRAYFCDLCKASDCNLPPNEIRNRYDAVCFHRGYTNVTMLFELQEINIGRGKQEWGGPDCDVFILKLGKRLT